MKDATDDYREEMDPVGAFLRDCVTVHPMPPDGKPVHTVTVRDMFVAFCAHCAVNSVRAWKEKSFSAAMTQKGFIKNRKTTVRFYVNVSLHDVPDARAIADVPPPASENDYAP